MLVITYPHLLTTYTHAEFLSTYPYFGILGLSHIKKPNKLTPALQQLMSSFMTAYPQSLKKRINC